MQCRASSSRAAAWLSQTRRPPGQPPTMMWPAAMLGFLCAVVRGTLLQRRPATTTPTTTVLLRTGALRLTLGQNGSYTLQVAGEALVHGAPLSLFVEGAEHTVASGGLRCDAPTPTNGHDEFGPYKGAELRCTAGAESQTPVVYSWHAYTAAPGSSGSAAQRQHQGKLVATMTLPDGATGTALVQPFDVHNTSPEHFAPFPAWRVEGAFNTSAFLCYGGDKSHLYSSHAASAGGSGIGGAPQTCFHLGNGPATSLWAPQLTGRALSGDVRGGGGGGAHALVAGPASSFHLNYHRLQATGQCV
jgi:hypothetical protein